MTWVLHTTSAADADPIALHHREVLAEKIRGCLDRLDTIIVEWRRGSSWLPTPIAVSMPKEAKARKLATPEEGAKILWNRAIEYATEKEARELRFGGLGESQSGDSVQVLFRLRVKPFEAREEDDDGGDSKRKVQNVAIEAAGVLKDLVGTMETHLQKHHDREVALLDRCVSLMEKNTASIDSVIVGMAYQRQMKLDEMDHEAHMEDSRRSSATADKLIDVVKGPASNFLEAWLMQHFGLSGDVFKGETFAKRLAAIVHGVGNAPGGDARLQKVKDIVGDEAWEVLKAMSNAASDEAFVAAGRKFLETLNPDATTKLQAAAAALGQGPAVVLLKLITDAGLA